MLSAWWWVPLAAAAVVAVASVVATLALRTGAGHLRQVVDSLERLDARLARSAQDGEAPQGPGRSERPGGAGRQDGPVRQDGARR